MDASPLLINIIGTLAGLCSMTSFIPQIVKIVQTRDASGVALHMFAVTWTGFVLWTAFGVLQNSWPIAVSNGVCLVLVSVILYLRLRFGDAQSNTGVGARG